MRNNHIICLVLIIGVVLISCNQMKKIQNKNELRFVELNDPNLGKIPSGIIPEIFGPNLISTDKMEHSSAIFLPITGDIYFARKTGVNNTIFYSSLKNGKYTEPQIASFSGRFFDGAPAFSANGDRLYFGSRRPLQDTSSTQKDFDIWVVEKIAEGWSKPKNIGFPVNTDAMEISQCLTSDGTLYFSSNCPGGKGQFDIYMSKFVNGKFTEPENLGDNINSEYFETSPCVAPDGSFILFDSFGRKEGKGIYISQKDEKGNWSKAIFLGPEINVTGTERFTNFSPDGKYLFFNSMRVIEGNDSTQYGNGLGDIYWIDAKVIEELNPEPLG
ncbi:PD40 domain-containing protein [bacterium]|nr:PD40 domain-containing protein [bacterium]